MSVLRWAWRITWWTILAVAVLTALLVAWIVWVAKR